MDDFTIKSLKDLLKLAEEQWDFEKCWDAWAMAKQNARLALHLEKMKLKEGIIDNG